MQTTRKNYLDLNLLSETSAVKFIGPKKVAYFSTYFDKEHKEIYYPDNSSQRYLVSTELNEPINCLEGYAPGSAKCVLPDKWKNFMRWIGKNGDIIRGLTSQNDSQQQIDFICTNTELANILLSLYQERDWIIHASRIRGEIFLYFTKDSRVEKGYKSQYDPTNAVMANYERLDFSREPEDLVTDELVNCKEEKEEQTSPSYGQQDANKLNYARWNIIRAEDSVTDELVNDKEEKETETTPDYGHLKAKKLNYARLNVIRRITQQVVEREVNSNAELSILSTVSFSKIGQHRILHAGNSEFVMSKDDTDKPINRASFAALKLMHNLFKGRNGGFSIPFRRRMYWWASALVSGVETLICGDLDEYYAVKKFKVIPPSNLDTKYSPEAQKKCLIASDKILHFIKSHVQESNKVYDFHLNAETKEVIVSPPEKFTETFVPDWYASGDIPDQADPYL